MSATCESCRWWTRSDYAGPTDEDYEPIEPDRWGQCSFILDNESSCMDREDVPHSARAYPADASGYSAWLVVRADFGCIEHEPAALRGQG